MTWDSGLPGGMNLYSAVMAPEAQGEPPAELTLVRLTSFTVMRHLNCGDLGLTSWGRWKPSDPVCVPPVVTFPDTPMRFRGLA